MCQKGTRIRFQFVRKSLFDNLAEEPLGHGRSQRLALLADIVGESLFHIDGCANLLKMKVLAIPFLDGCHRFRRPCMRTEYS